MKSSGHHRSAPAHLERVRPGESGTEVDLRITGDTAWQRLGSGDARVGVQCAFAYADGPNPRGGRVERVDLG